MGDKKRKVNVSFVILSTLFCIVIGLAVMLGSSAVQVQAASQVEIEATAEKLTLNSGKRGMITYDERKKWYIFNIEENGFFKVKLDTTENTDGSKIRSGWEWNLYKQGRLESPIKSLDYITKTTNSDYYCLGQGTYYLLIQGSRQDFYLDPFDCEYELTVLFEQEKNTEEEENDTASTANVIKKDVTYFGSIYDSDDLDWYKISVDDNTAMSLTLDVDVRSNSDNINQGWKVKIYDATLLNCLKEYKFNKKTETAYLPVSKGDYYISVESNGSYHPSIDAVYTLNATFGSEYWEAEDNDTAGKATVLKAGTDAKSLPNLFGTLYKADDVDWWKVNITKNGWFKIILYTDSDIEHREWFQDGYQMEVYASDMSEVYSGTWGSAEFAVTDEIPWGKGIYYIKIAAKSTNRAPVDYEYSLAVHQKADKKYEKEPNNEFENANTISKKSFKHGVLTTSDDVDCYVFNVKKKAKYTITLKKDEDYYIDDHGWDIELYNSDKERIEITENITKQGTITATLNPGKYYIAVSGNYKTGWFGYDSQAVWVLYKLTVKSK